jgi:hypothetical protein
VHAFGQARPRSLLLVIRSSLRALLSQRNNVLLEVEAPLDWLLCEITPSWLPEHVTTEIVGDANTSAVARAVAVRALGFCYLEGSYSAPPIVDPDSRNASRSARRIRTSLPVGLSALRRPARIWFCKYLGVQIAYCAACFNVNSG